MVVFNLRNVKENPLCPYDASALSSHSTSGFWQTEKLALSKLRRAVSSPRSTYAVQRSGSFFLIAEEAIVCRRLDILVECHGPMPRAQSFFDLDMRFAVYSFQPSRDAKSARVPLMNCRTGRRPHRIQVADPPLVFSGVKTRESQTSRLQPDGPAVKMRL